MSVQTAYIMATKALRCWVGIEPTEACTSKPAQNFFVAVYQLQPIVKVRERGWPVMPVKAR